MTRIKFRYPIYKEMYEAKIEPCILDTNRVWYCKSCVRMYRLSML